MIAEINKHMLKFSILSHSIISYNPFTTTIVAVAANVRCCLRRRRPPVHTILRFFQNRIAHFSNCATASELNLGFNQIKGKHIWNTKWYRASESKGGKSGFARSRSKENIHMRIISTHVRSWKTLYVSFISIVYIWRYFTRHHRIFRSTSVDLAWILIIFTQLLLLNWICSRSVCH